MTMWWKPRASTQVIISCEGTQRTEYRLELQLPSACESAVLRSCTLVYRADGHNDDFVCIPWPQDRCQVSRLSCPQTTAVATSIIPS